MVAVGFFGGGEGVLVNVFFCWEPAAQMRPTEFGPINRRVLRTKGDQADLILSLLWLETGTCLELTRSGGSCVQIF